MTATLFQRTRWTVGVASALALGAMLRYECFSASLASRKAETLGARCRCIWTVRLRRVRRRRGHAGEPRDGRAHRVHPVGLANHAYHRRLARDCVTARARLATTDGLRDDVLVVQVIAQKVATVAVMATVLFAAREIDRLETRQPWRKPDL